MEICVFSKKNRLQTIANTRFSYQLEVLTKIDDIVEIKVLKDYHLLKIHIFNVFVALSVLIPL